MSTSENNELVSFKARDYQEEILRQALSENVIIYLPTGSGKTYIVTLLIREMGEGLEKGKRTVFLVNTVPLVEQQSAVLSQHLPYKVRGFTGDMKVDYWDRQRWNQELNNIQIIVLTTQIFLNMVQHDFYSVKNVNLLIFDECHHAANDHAMRQLTKLFENAKESIPRIVGLTATLLNKNVNVEKIADEIRSLEISLNAKITTSSDPQIISKFSANPNEIIIEFKNERVAEAVDIIASIDDMIIAQKEFKEFLDKPNSNDRIEEKKYNRNLENNKNLINWLEDYKLQIEYFGIAFLPKINEVYFQLLNQEAIMTSDDHFYQEIYCILNMMNQHCKIAQKFINSAGDEIASIEKYSSNKLKTVLQLVQECSKQLGETDNIILFTTRRSTAKILFMIFDHISKFPQYNKIKPTFLLGQNKKLFNLQSNQLNSKNFKMSISAFRDGFYNLMISTDLLEEGIDLPDCSFVIKFDEITNYRSYMQSKGRCRKKNGYFYILIDKNNANNFKKKYYKFIETNSALKQILSHDNRTLPTEEEINSNLYNDVIPPYYVNDDKTGACLTAITSMKILYQYCASLSTDSVSVLEPYWFKTIYHDVGTNNYISSLEMPMESGIYDTIRGDAMCTKKLSKFSVSFKVCRMLMENKQLNPNLLPVSRKVSIDASTQHFYPNWNYDEKITNVFKFKKKYLVPRTPSIFLNDPVFSESNFSNGSYECYLHILKFGANTKDLFWNASYSKGQKIGLLTKSRLPKLLKFSLLIHDGVLDVNVSENSANVSVTAADRDNIVKFNICLFRDIVESFRPFYQYANKSGLSNNLLVVPVSEKKEIDYGLIREVHSTIEVNEPSYEQRKNMTITMDKYANATVIPWYGNNRMPCIVIDVCQNMTPYSPFPNEDYSNYADYFNNKYGITVYNKEQRLLQVKNIRKCSNYLRRRQAKIKKHDADYTMHLIPEFCTLQKIPGDFWAKMIILPSVLFRIENLLKAEELRDLIFENESLFKKSSKNCIGSMLDLNHNEIDAAVDTSQTVEMKKLNDIMDALQKRTLGKPNFEQPNEDFESGSGENETILPGNLDCSKNPTLFETYYYCSYIMQNEFDLPLSSSFALHNTAPLKLNNVSTATSSKNHQFPIAFLSNSIDSEGPSQFQILQALTTTDAKDIFNYERYETLGDSLLKLVVSFYLYLKFPKFTEGMLVEIKGQLVGNENLFYNGLYRRLADFIQVTDLNPLINWRPPSFAITDPINNVFRYHKRHIPNSMLYDFKIPLEEQVSGVLSEKTRKSFDEKLAQVKQTNDEMYPQLVDDQVIQRKQVSDSVEALIGLFLTTNGLFGGISLIKYFCILPNDEVLQTLFKEPATTAFIRDSIDVSRFVRNLKQLESILGYEFRDRSNLLQALTHLSYYPNRFTKSYQRYEFLGDAVLDFLITSHIFETCNNFTPGQITDLRSALVNNITFAALTVRLGLHKHILYNNSTLFALINKFVSIQQSNNHNISEPVLFLITEEDRGLADMIDVPKILGDIWESLAGAIFIDSNYNLQTVWNVFYKLMINEIIDFKKNIPKNPIRLFEEMKNILQPSELEFKTFDVGKTACSCLITINNTKYLTTGYGSSKKMAKQALSKLAIRQYDNLRSK